MKHLAVFLMLMTAPAAAQEQAPSGYWRMAIDVDKPISVEATPDADLILKWGMADENCRGGGFDDLVKWEACGLRDAYGMLLTERGLCINGPLVTNKWEACES